MALPKVKQPLQAEAEVTVEVPAPVLETPEVTEVVALESTEVITPEVPEAPAPEAPAEPAAGPIIEYVGEGAELVKFTINPKASRYVVNANGRITEDM